MSSPAKQARVPVAVRFSDEVFRRNTLVSLQPFRWGELLEFRPEHEIQFRPDLVQLWIAGNPQNGMVNRRNECVVQLWISPLTKPEERKNCVIQRSQMAPDVDKSVSIGRDFQFQFFWS